VRLQPPILTRRYGLSKVVRRAKVLAVEPVFAADYDAAAHLQAGRPPRMPTAFRLALDDGSTLSAKRVVAAVCSSHAAACHRDVVCWTGQCSVDRRMLHVARYVVERPAADSRCRALARSMGSEIARTRACACTNRTERRPQGMRLAQECTRLLQVGPNNTPRIPSWAHAHLVRQPSHMVCASPAVLRPYWGAPSVHSVHLRFVNHERCITTHSANASAGLSHGVGRLPLALGH
jgi:hypothetical protein